MNICVSIGHGKSAKGGYDSGAQNICREYARREIRRFCGDGLRSLG